MEITNLLLRDKYIDIKTLQQDLQRKDKKGLPELYDVDIFNVIIRRATENTKLIGDHLQEGTRLLVASVAGDSSVTAHYRLGVGVNNAFVGLSELGKMVQDLNKIGTNHLTVGDLMIPEIRNIIEAKNKVALKRTREMVQFELSTMFYESVS